jgi:hypothetical protein
VDSTPAAAAFIDPDAGDAAQRKGGISERVHDIAWNILDAARSLDTCMLCMSRTPVMARFDCCWRSGSDGRMCCLPCLREIGVTRAMDLRGARFSTCKTIEELEKLDASHIIRNVPWCPFCRSDTNAFDRATLISIPPPPDVTRRVQRITSALRSLDALMGWLMTKTRLPRTPDWAVAVVEWPKGACGRRRATCGR